jgi:hypothetical protein
VRLEKLLQLVDEVGHLKETHALTEIDEQIDIRIVGVVTSRHRSDDTDIVCAMTLRDRKHGAAPRHQSAAETARVCQRARVDLHDVSVPR